MLNIMGCFVLQAQVFFNLVEKGETYGVLRFYAQRIFFVFAVLGLTVVFPDINIVLSLFTGSICGSLLFILPVFFYRQAYFVKPSKKDRTP